MSEQGLPAPLSTRNLAIATLVAIVLAGLALTVYILPASYGVDPIGTGQAFSIDGQAPTEDASSPQQAPEIANATSDVPELYRYEATWPTADQPGPEAEGYTAEGETTTVELELPTVNLTQATITLTWQDDNETAGQQTEPDELELVLEAPDGTQTEPVRAENEPDGEGTLEATLELRSPPANESLHATDADTARAQALAKSSTTELAGAWKAHVTVVEAGDAEGADTMPMGPGQDEGTDWQLASSASTYELRIEDRGVADVREDERSFTLAPGEGMEHKVTLAANETLAYAWRTSSPVYYDYHAEPDGESGFTSYETATAEAANGTLTAPFTGTHGWYWENQGEQPVRIELTTRGDYTDGFTT